MSTGFELSETVSLLDIKPVRRHWLIVCIVLCAWFCGIANASKLLVITAVKEQPDLEQRIRYAADFYGIEVESFAVDKQADEFTLARSAKKSNALGIVVTTEALNSRQGSALLGSLERRRFDLPVMIVASGSVEDSRILAAATRSAITACAHVDPGDQDWQMLFRGQQGLSEPLDGVVVKSADAPVCTLQFAPARSTHLLTSMQQGKELYPTLISLHSNGPRLFVAASLEEVAKISPESATRMQETFSAIAAPMIFLRAIAGDKLWHLPEHDANLTIDDPWLTEPYGNLSYEALLRQMQLHHFHTTIAFVPWNFDRSDPHVSELFLHHPEVYSISVHGNNHNHREFGSYATQLLRTQEQNLQQARARMNKFQQLTGIPYDRVMIFPHAIAPAETFSSLEKSGFWATINSENVPLGSPMPADFLYPLRPWTLDFSQIPSVRRVSAEVPVSAPNMAIQAFLGNPQLFYIHQEFFEKGIDAFNSTADAVNKLEPDLHWSSLGDVVRHLYLLRQRDDGDYDVRLLSSHVELVNPTDHHVTFHLLRVGVPKDAKPIAFIEGMRTDVNLTSDELQLQVTLGPQEHRKVELYLQDPYISGSSNIVRTSLLINMDRWLSDFRDMQLSRSSLGRKIQDLYYRHGLDSVEGAFERRMLLLVSIFVGCLLVMLLVRRSRRVKVSMKQEA